MRTKTLYAFALSAAMFVGCSENSLEESMSGSPESGHEVSVSVASPTSRMSVETNESNGNWAIAWEQGDGATGWSDKDELVTMTMVGDIDSDGFVSFSGSIADESTTSMRLLYPYNSATYDSASAVNISIAEQNIDMDDTYNSFGDSNLYMISDAFNISGSDYTTMSHLFSFIKLSVTATDITDEQLKLAKVEISGLSKSSAKIGFDFDTDSPSYGTTSAEDTITINISNADALVAGEAVTIPFSIVPFTAYEGQQITAVLTFEDGSVVTKKYVLGSDFIGVNYTRAETNKFAISFKAEDIVVKETLELTYSTTSFGLGTSSYTTSTGAATDLTINSESANLSDYTISDSLSGAGAEFFDFDSSTGEISINEAYSLIPGGDYEFTLILTDNSTSEEYEVVVTIDVTLNDGIADGCEIIDLTALTGDEQFDSAKSWVVVNAGDIAAADLTALATLMNAAGAGAVALEMPNATNLAVSTDDGIGLRGCTGLGSIKLNNAIDTGVSVGNHACRSCSNLTYIEGNISSLGAGAFRSSGVLTEVKLTYDGTITVGSISFTASQTTSCALYLGSTEYANANTTDLTWGDATNYWTWGSITQYSE